MGPTPYEVVSLYLEYDRLCKASVTSLQKAEWFGPVARALQNVQWEIEVSDVTGGEGGFELRGKVIIPELRKWRGEWSMIAWLRGDELRERLLQVKVGQRVRLEGGVNCISSRLEGYAWGFSMYSARLLTVESVGQPVTSDGKSCCFVATAAYASPHPKERESGYFLEVLRKATKANREFKPLEFWIACAKLPAAAVKSIVTLPGKARRRFKGK